MRHTIAGVLFLLGVGGSAPAAAVKPNILFIAVDDLNGWLSHLGSHPNARTPHLDRLAARGATFRHAYTAAPVCNPSRAALLVGQRPSTTGVYGNGNPWYPVVKDVVTLPQFFMRGGYQVVGGGKLFHKFPQEKAKEYFHQFFMPTGGARPGRSQKPLNGFGVEQFDWGPIETAPEKMNDALTVAWAIDFLGKKQNKPFFLGVGFQKPHLPWYVPKKYFDMHPLDSIHLPPHLEDDLKDVPPAGKKFARQGDHAAVLKANQWKNAVQAYLATISFVDEQIGRLLDGLDKSAYAENTAIVLWGDHGWSLGEKSHWRKMALWEETTRTPLMFVVPGVTKPGTAIDRPVDLMDVYPTLVSLAGFKRPEHLEGHDLLPLLRNPKATWKHAALSTYQPNNHAVRTDKWRYIRYHDGSEELYDRAKDPNEWKNLASDPKTAGVRQELARHLPKVNVPEAPRGKGKGEGDDE